VEGNVDHIFSFSGSLQRLFDRVECGQVLQPQIENILWKVLAGDKLKPMKLPARLFLAVLTLSIGSLTPIAPPQMSLADWHTSDRCTSVNTGRCHSCPTTMDETTSASASPRCATQSSCCALYFTRATRFFADMHLIGTVGVRNERVTTRAQRPPVPPPRGAFS
jgi:hypothetical protein